MPTQIRFEHACIHVIHDLYLYSVAKSTYLEPRYILICQYLNYGHLGLANHCIFLYLKSYMLIFIFRIYVNFYFSEAMLLMVLLLSWKTTATLAPLIL